MEGAKIASIPVVLLNGQTADANEVMADFNEIYSNIDQTNIASSAKTGTGRIVLDTAPTISSLTLSNPTITGNITGTPAWLGAPTFNAGLTLLTTQHLNLNVGGTTSIAEGAPGTIYFNAGGSLQATLDTSNFSITGGMRLNTSQRLYLDGGINDYWVNSANGVNELWADGTLAMYSNASAQINFTHGWIINAGYPGYWDGGGDTFTDEVSANNLRFTIGGNDALRMQRVDANRVNFGFNGNGTNPNTLYANSDIVIGNTTNSVNRSLVIQSTSANTNTLSFSDAANTNPGFIEYAHSSDQMTIASTGNIIIETNSDSGQFNANCELILPNRSAPSTILAGSARSFAKAYVLFDATGTVLNSFNCSVSRTALGTYTITFTTPFTSINSYTVVANAASGGLGSSAMAGRISASRVDVVTGSAALGPTDLGAYVVVFGT